jgi:hypothetical protein
VVVVGVDEHGETIMQKPGNLPGTGERGGKNGMPDTDFALSYPHITEYLITSQWDDGTNRRPSSLSFFVEQGVVKLSLYDKACERSLFVSAESLLGALKTMEAALATSSIPWVAWKKPRK